MKQKTLKKHVYVGLGFPVELVNVQMRYIRNEWHPIIDVEKVATAVIQKIIFQEQRFSGAQIKFVRTYFRMSLREFAGSVVRESHTTVAKWEKKGENPTNMDINIEILLRLYMYDKLFAESTRSDNDFHEKYVLLQHLPYLSAPSHIEMICAKQ